MRVRVDREAGAVRVLFGDAAAARRTAAAGGVVVLTDAAERVVGIEVSGVDPAELGGVMVDLAALSRDEAVHPAPAPVPPPRPAPAPPPAAYTGLLNWDAEAEEAVLQVPFFSRGRVRLAASALARRQGLDRVTAAVVRAAGH